MKRRERENSKARNIVWGVLLVLATIVAAVIGLGAMDLFGAMVHTAIAAAFADGTSVMNYVVEKREQVYFVHTFLRALIAAVAFMQFCDKLQSSLLRNVVARIMVFAISLEMIEFAAYAVEFLGIAFWRAITSGFHDIRILNVIKLRYLDRIDLIARLGQGFLAANIWFLWRRARARREREDRETQERLEAVPDNLRSLVDVVDFCKKNNLDAVEEISKFVSVEVVSV